MPNSPWRNNDPIGVTAGDLANTPKNVQFGFDPSEMNNPDRYLDTQTFASAGTFHMGSLILAEDGELLLAGDGFEIVLHEEASGENAYFVGGQENDENVLAGRCDINCRDNILVVQPGATYNPAMSIQAQRDSGALANSTIETPMPCNRDTLHVPAGAHTLRAKGHLFYDEMYFHGEGEELVTSRAQIPARALYSDGEHDFDEIEIWFGQEAVDFCRSINALENNVLCICENHCPSSIQELLDAQARRDELAQAAAEQALAEANAPFTSTFDLRVDTTLLGVDDGAVECFFQIEESNEFLNSGSYNATLDPFNIAKEDLMSIMESQFMENWGAVPDEVEITFIEFQKESKVLEVSGRITARKASFIEIDDEVYQSANILVTDISQVPANNKYAVIAINAFVDTVNNCELQSQQCLPQQLKAALVTLCGTCDFVSFLEDESAPGQLINNLQSISTDENATNLMLSDDTRSDIVLEAAVTFLNETDDATIAAIIDQLTVAEQCVGVEEELVGDLSILQPATFTLPTITIGHTASKYKMNQILSPQNKDVFIDAIVTGLPGTSGLLSVDAGSFDFKFIDRAEFLNGEERRDIGDSAGPSTLLLEVTMDYQQYYTALCEDESLGIPATDCPIVDGSDRWADVQDHVDHIFTLYDLQQPLCVDVNQQEVAPFGFDPQCLREQADQAIAQAQQNAQAQGVTLTQEQLAQIGANTIYEITRCGLLGQDIDGNCIDSSNEDSARDFADATGSASASSALSSDSGFPIVIIAAAAAAIVIIAIIVVVVVMRRKGGDSDGGFQRTKSKKTATTDRTVVAFENPMYDDPGTDYGAQPVYDDADPDDEGLYDEPAFNADTKKANPMYQSAESLDNMMDDDAMYDDDEDDEGGYLDVAPDDDE